MQTSYSFARYRTGVYFFISEMQVIVILQSQYQFNQLCVIIHYAMAI